MNSQNNKNDNKPKELSPLFFHDFENYRGKKKTRKKATLQRHPYC